MLTFELIGSHGDIPEGFRSVSLGSGRSMLVSNGQDADVIANFILMAPASAAEETRYEGRAGLRSLHLDSCGNGLVRSYQHGGVFRRWTRDWFFTWPPRPFVELMVTEVARQRGVPTLEVVAAFVVCRYRPFYRGWLVTRELPDAEDLWRVVRKRGLASSNAGLMQQAGKAVRLMHDAGVYHADLNMRNLLIRPDAQGVLVIDFDKARIFEHAVPPGWRYSNVRRLLRSIKKLDPMRQHVSEEDWESFLFAYHD